MDLAQQSFFALLHGIISLRSSRPDIEWSPVIVESRSTPSCAAGPPRTPRSARTLAPERKIMKPQAFAVAFAWPPAVALGCGGEGGPAETPARPVVTTGVKVADVEERISATGQLQAKDRAEIAAEVPGQVTSIAVEEGDPVEAGGIVLEIDPQKRELELADVRAHLAETRAALTEQERAFARWKSLHDQNIAADSRMDEVETGPRAGALAPRGGRGQGRRRGARAPRRERAGALRGLRRAPPGEPRRVRPGGPEPVRARRPRPDRGRVPRGRARLGPRGAGPGRRRSPSSPIPASRSTAR